MCVYSMYVCRSSLCVIYASRNRLCLSLRVLLVDVSLLMCVCMYHACLSACRFVFFDENLMYCDLLG